MTSTSDLPVQLAITLICDEGRDLAAVVDFLPTVRRQRFRREILWRLSSMVDEGTYSPRTKELADEISATEYSFVHLLGSERVFMEEYYEDGWSFAELAESDDVPEWIIRQCHTSILGRLAAMEESGHISPKIPRLKEDLASWASSPEIPLSADLVERWLYLSLSETRIGTFIRNGLPLDQQQKLWRSSTPVYETRITKAIGPDNEDLGFSWLLTVYMEDKEGTFGRVSGNEYNGHVGSTSASRNTPKTNI